MTTGAPATQTTTGAPATHNHNNHNNHNNQQQQPQQPQQRAKIKIDTFSKLGFVHRRSVFEPPEPKVDYHYYVFGEN
jgi:hypothetical protein